MDAQGRSLYGYDAVGTLGALLDELRGAAAGARRRVHVAVKCHPTEWPGALGPVIAGVAGPWLGATLVRGTPRGWIAAADAVAGMMSIALLEAAVAGRPTISIQVGLRASGAEDPCIGNILGYTRPVLDRAALRDAARRIASGGAAGLASTPSRSLALDGAAARVAELVLGRGPARSIPIRPSRSANPDTRV